MSSVSAFVDVSAPRETVFRYLRGRYDRETHRSASLAAKGYVPNVICLNADPNRRLEFQVKARDPLLRVFIGGWRWIYEIEPTSQSASRVRITYCWSLGMSVLGCGTTRHQACNELTETAMALEALGFGGGEPGGAADPAQ